MVSGSSSTANSPTLETVSFNLTQYRRQFLKVHGLSPSLPWRSNGIEKKHLRGHFMGLRNLTGCVALPTLTSLAKLLVEVTHVYILCRIYADTCNWIYSYVAHKRPRQV